MHVLLLGLDTATPAVTVALHDGTQPLAQLVTVDAHRHAELLAPAIAKLIADAGVSQQDLTGVAVGVGPGPYTGLRVGVVTARVLGEALGIPVYGVCSLDVIAADVASDGTARPAGDFLVATDARRRELYWARYDRTGRRLAGPDVSAPAQIPDRELPAAGEGSRLYPDLLPNATGPGYPAAVTLCRVVVAALGSGETAAEAGTGGGTALLPPEPLYLRRPDAREPGSPKRVSQ